MMKKTNLLGEITPKQFLQTYWQKKPLLVRQAIPGMSALLSRETLFDLAIRDDVESRLITNFRQQWKMQHGPLSQLPKPNQKNWTMLLQGVNLHDDEADKLLNQFRFIPDSRLDDLMISYATDGGGVGPHFDSYDVFLLQVHGKRRWRISAQKDLTLEEGLPLKILRNFIPEAEFILEPGDMLYLPPHYAHEGVAIGECMTYSVGFRAPAWQELGERFLEFMADSIDLPGRYTDAGHLSQQTPAKISDHLLETVTTELSKLASTPEDIAIFLGQHLSEPKSSVFFEPPERALSPAKFIAAIAKQGLKLHRKTRMLYRSRYIFINGESFQPGATDRKLLMSLADEKMLSATDLKSASHDLLESLHAWYCEGWIVVNQRENLSSETKQ
jgi:50S ribosomal protein L16 3-hydroxylase